MLHEGIRLIILFIIDSVQFILSWYKIEKSFLSRGRCYDLPCKRWEELEIPFLIPNISFVQIPASCPNHRLPQIPFLVSKPVNDQILLLVLQIPFSQQKRVNPTSPFSLC